MKLLQTCLAHDATVSAPALSRGLAVLVALGEKSPLSLEMLACELELPKASVFRFLGTLRQMGMVRKNPDKCYEPLWALQPLEDEPTRFRQNIELVMGSVCEAAAATVEWYEHCPEGMKLVLQKCPESEVRVQAKPGFLRPWNREFDAVARLGHALVSKAPKLTAARLFVADGVLESLSPAEFRKLLYEAKTNRAAQDAHFNCNGVRRCAVAAMRGATCLGVLALAECCRFPRRSRQRGLIKLLQTTLFSI